MLRRSLCHQRQTSQVAQASVGSSEARLATRRVCGNVSCETPPKMAENPLPQPADFRPLSDPEAHGVRISTLNELAATLSAILPNTQHVSKTS